MKRIKIVLSIFHKNRFTTLCLVMHSFLLLNTNYTLLKFFLIFLIWVPFSFLLFLSRRVTVWQYKCYHKGEITNTTPREHQWMKHTYITHRFTQPHSQGKELRSISQCCRISISNLKSTSSHLTSFNELLIEAQAIDYKNWIPLNRK